MGIIDKCVVRGDATLCVVIFNYDVHLFVSLWTMSGWITPYYLLYYSYDTSQSHTFALPLNSKLKLYFQEKLESVSRYRQHTPQRTSTGPWTPSYKLDGNSRSSANGRKRSLVNYKGEQNISFENKIF